jgi:hypothetical protein
MADLASALSTALCAEETGPVLPDWVLGMDGYSGRKYRAFVNRLIRLIDAARYLEVGTWKGSTLCAAIYGNAVRATAIENWSEFGGPRFECGLNVTAALAQSPSASVRFIESDFAAVDWQAIGRHNVYLFDGSHAEHDQYNGVVMAQDALDAEHILIVDDWNWDRVRRGTMRAIEALGLEIITKAEIRTTHDGSHPPVFGPQSDWHNGYFMGVVRKASA